jgi:hypothetical protein
MKIHIINQLIRLMAFRQQGDQIGRVFAPWAIVYFGEFLENHRSSQKLRATFFQCKNNVSILTKKSVGLHFGHFFTKSPGHPVRQSQDCSAGDLGKKLKSMD